MTENEAKEYLSNRYLVVDSPENPPKEECEKHNSVMNMAIKALEEIQQYRAIGTVEGYEKAIQSSMEYYNLMKEYKARVDELEAIGTIEEFKTLKEKNTPKKPNQVSKAMDKDKYVGLIGRCPHCSSIVAEDNLVCEDCFQVLDWSE